MAETLTAVMTQATFRCTALATADDRCIRLEGHGGRHSAGIIPTSGLCICEICKGSFASSSDFAKHVPCAGAVTHLDLQGASINKETGGEGCERSRAETRGPGVEQ